MQVRVSSDETTQILARLNGADRQHVLPLYPISLSNTLQFFFVPDGVEMVGSRQRNDAYLVGAHLICVDDVVPGVFRKRDHLRSLTRRGATRNPQLLPTPPLE